MHPQLHLLYLLIIAIVTGYTSLCDFERSDQNMRKFMETLYARKVLQVEEEQKVCVVDNICVNIAHTLSLLYCVRDLSHKNKKHFGTKQN